MRAREPRRDRRVGDDREKGEGGPVLLGRETGREEATAQAKKIFEGLQKGTIDRALFTENANAYFSEEALRDFASSLKPLGAPKSFTQSAAGLRGGMTRRRFKIAFEKRTLDLTTYSLPDGKLEQYMVAAAE